MSSNKVFSVFLGIWPIPQPEKQFKQAYISMVEKFLIGLEGIEEITFSSDYKMTVAGCCFQRKI